MVRMDVKRVGTGKLKKHKGCVKRMGYPVWWGPLSLFFLDADWIDTKIRVESLVAE